jgi:hypothetical protein
MEQNFEVNIILFQKCCWLIKMKYEKSEHTTKENNPWQVSGCKHQFLHNIEGCAVAD